jgi:dolichol kinase
MWPLVAAVALAYVGLDAARLRWPAWNAWAFRRFAPLLRPREARRLTGASYSLLALVLGVAVFPPRILAAAFLYHSIGDPMAGWIGRRFGRHRIGDKSLEGAVAFVLSGSAATWPLVGGLPAAAGAVLGALAELALPLDDNLTVPLAGGLGIAAVGRLAGGA